MLVVVRSAGVYFVVMVLVLLRWVRSDGSGVAALGLLSL